MGHRMKEIKPTHHPTKEEVQEMIDDAIRKHNRNAGIISMCVGWVVLALFAEGFTSTYRSNSTTITLVKNNTMMSGLFVIAFITLMVITMEITWSVKK
jgi:hypothetical protein